MRSIATRTLGILALCMATSALGFQAAAEAPVMVLYYKFDETVGNKAFDSSGNHYDGDWFFGAGTVASSATIAPVANIPGNQRSLLFTKPAANNTAGAYVTTPHNTAFTFVNPFTVMCWINPVEIVAMQNGNDRQSIIQKWIYQNNQLAGWSVERLLGGRIQFITGSLQTTDYVTTTATVAPGGWHHVACVWTGTAKLIYIDGVERANVASTVIPYANTIPLHVGKDDFTRNYTGNVDDVRLFSGAMTAAQVLQCYNGVNAPLNLTAPPGPDEAQLSWTASPTAQNYDIYRSTVQGGPYSFLVNIPSGATTTYVDTTALQGATYYYVVKSRVGTLASAYSNEAACTPTINYILINPKAISVAESGGVATFTVTLRTAPNNTSVVINLSSTPGGLINLNGPGGTPGATAQLTFLANQPLTQTVTVTGIPRGIQGPNLTANINFAVTSTDVNYDATHPNPRPVICTIIQDTPGLVINPAAGLSTTNGGPATTFTVSLATQTIPANGANLAFSVSDPNIATVAVSGGNPAILSTAGTTLTVTVTPLLVDTTTTFIGPYTIDINMATSTDPGYAALGIVRVPIFTETNLPPLEHLWSCGLIGPEALLALAAAALWRRRRRSCTSA